MVLTKLNSEIICHQIKHYLLQKTKFVVNNRSNIALMQKTTPNVSEKALKDVYQSAIMNCLTDKVTNVRLKSMQVLKSYSKLSNPTI
jgi:hypothetical protein